MMMTLVSCSGSQSMVGRADELDPKAAPYGIGTLRLACQSSANPGSGMARGQHSVRRQRRPCARSFDDAALLDLADYSGEQLLGDLRASILPARSPGAARRAAGPPAGNSPGWPQKGSHIPIKYSYRNLGTLSGQPVGLLGCRPQPGVRARQLGMGQRQHPPAGDNGLLKLAGYDAGPGFEPIHRQGRGRLDSRNTRAGVVRCTSRNRPTICSTSRSRDCSTTPAPADPDGPGPSQPCGCRPS